MKRESRAFHLLDHGQQLQSGPAFGAFKTPCLLRDNEYLEFINGAVNEISCISYFYFYLFFLHLVWQHWRP